MEWMQGGFHVRHAALLVVFAMAGSACSGDEGRAASSELTTTTTTPGESTAAATVSGATAVDVDSSEPEPTSSIRSVPARAPTSCDPGQTDAQPRTIHVWHALNTEVGVDIAALARQFEADHSGITVVVEEVSDGLTALVDKLRSTSDDSLPDVVLGSPVINRLLADSGRFVPVEDCFDGARPHVLEGLLPVVESAYTVDGRLWAAPFNVSTPLLYFDRRRWREAGLDPDRPPTTMVELEAAVRAIKDSGAATTGIALYDRSAGWLIHGAAAEDGSLLVEPANGRARTVTEVTLDLPAVRDVLSRFQVLRRDGYVHWLGWDIGPDEANDLLQLVNPIEPTGMTLHSSASLGQIIRFQEQGAIPDVEIGIAPFPTSPAAPIVGGGAWWLGGDQDAGQVGAAWTLVEALLQPEVLGSMAAESGYVPTTAAAAQQPVVEARWAEYPVLKVAYDQLAAAVPTDANAGIQVGPGVEVDREIELAAAFTIDAGNEPEAELALRSAAIHELIRAYEETLDSS